MSRFVLSAWGFCLSCPAPFEPPEPQPLDIPGSIVITASLGLMTFALLEAGRNGAFTLFQIIVLIVGAVLLIVFFELQKRLKTPMLPPFLMQDRRFVLVSVQTFVLFAGFQSAMYFLSFLLIQSLAIRRFRPGLPLCLYL